MVGFILLVACLGCGWIGGWRLTEYQRWGAEPSILGESLAGFLGAALNLAAAAVWFYKVLS
jgi:hypothetical protein